MSDAQKPEEQLPEGSQQKPEGISEPHLPADSVSDTEQPSDTESKNQSRSKNERETAENKSSAPRVTADSQPAKSSKSALVIAIIALLAVPAVGYWGYQQQTKLSSKLDSANAQLADELASKNSSLRNQLANLEGELARLDDEREAQNLLLERTQSRLSDAIKQVEAGRNTSEADWRLAEAQYLLRLANQRVLMEQRPEGALSMLRTADKVLAELDDVSLYGLRQSLAQDIAKLEAVPKLDVEGTYLRLAALINQSRELPTLSLEQQRQLPELLQEITPESVDETLQQDIQSALGKAMASLESLVVIQQHDRPVEPLLSPEQGHYLRQNLQLLLEQAQLALLRQQQVIFDTSLARSAELTERYFDTNNSATQALLQALSELKTLRVEPTMPNISGSLTQLQQHMSDMTRLGAEAQK
jgi:uroporphyrin-3 C-methyltransferase